MKNNDISNIIGFVVSIGGLLCYLKDFFAWYLNEDSNIILKLVLMGIATIFGGAIWNLLCKIFNWPYFMGGSGNEPRFGFAFLWGIITLAPVIICAFLLYRKGNLNNLNQLLEWVHSKDILIISIFIVLAGTGASIFYTTPIRKFIEHQQYSYEIQELLIVSIWALTISTIPFLSFLLFKKIYGFNVNIWYLGTGLLYSMVMPIMFVMLFLSFFQYTKIFEQVRGLFAGFGLRLGIYLGLLKILQKSLI